MAKVDVAPLPQGDDKVRAVRAMFDSIAPRYDLVNRIMTFRMDVGWRRRTVPVLAFPCGTGGLCDERGRTGYTAVGGAFPLGMLSSAHTAAPPVQADALR